MQETWVRSLSWEDPWRTERLPTPVFWPGEFRGLVHRLQRVRHDWATFTCGSVQFSSVAQPYPTLCDRMDCSIPGFPVYYQLLEFTQTLGHWVSDAIQQSHPLSSPSPPPSIFPCIRVFSKESVIRIRWPKYWSFSSNISPSSEYSGLISFRMDYLDLLGLQGTLKSLLQHHSSKASILQCSIFFTVQLSHPYMTTGKTVALTRWTFWQRNFSAFHYAI